jgi:hypothetical protein
MSNKIVNFYDKLEISKNSNLPKTWKKHHIYNNSHTLCLGGTGTGKSNALINYISRSSGEFNKIIVCSFSTTDEPLYNLLESKNIELINDIDEVPELQEFDDKHKDKPKLIVFDDFINVEKKKMKKIYDYSIAGRKMGFSVWCLCQDYASCPKIIVRNISYIICFKINDNISLNNIIRNHNIADVDSIVIKSACNLCTQDFGNFFMIDLKGSEKENFSKIFLVS